MEKRRIYIGGFKEFIRAPLSQPSVFIAHDFSGRDREDEPRDAPRQTTDYRLAYDDGLREAGFHPVYAPDYSGTILETLVQAMINTDAGIFDVSFGRKYNANVLIELGISIGLNHPTIVVAEEADRPVLEFLDSLDVHFYKNDDDLADCIGHVVQKHVDDYNARLSPHFCTTCKNKQCHCRKQLTQLEKTYLLIGAQDHTGIQRHMKAVAKEFDLHPLVLASETDHHSTLCTWLYNIKRSKFVLLYSQELGKRHHGKENAATMLQLGLALGANIPWRFIIEENETPPTDIVNYIDIRVTKSAEVTRSNLRGAIGAINDENNPYHGIYDILPISEPIEEDVLSIDVILPSKSKLFMAPTLAESHISPPPQWLDNAVQQIIDDTSRESGVIIGIAGTAGEGKTTLASAICHDERIQQTFLDGILWLTTGKNQTLLGKMSDLIYAVTGETISIATIEEARANLHSTIESGSFLIVLDDVATIEDIHPFIIPDTKSSYLITTRNKSILEEINAQILPLPETRPSIYIAYRRAVSEPLARIIEDFLGDRGFHVFRDVMLLRPGNLEEQLLDQIATCDAVLVIVGEGTFDRASNPDDWLRRELLEAHKLNKNIVPLIQNQSMSWDTLPTDLEFLAKFNALPVAPAYFNSSLEKLVERLLPMEQLQDDIEVTDNVVSQTRKKQKTRKTPKTSSITPSRPIPIFISYRSKPDKTTNDLLHSLADAKQVWRDKYNIPATSDWQNKILDAINDTESFLLLSDKNHHLQVYISTASDDLSVHQEVVQDAVLHAKMSPSITKVQAPLTVVLETVKYSDIYIVIIGHHYGYIPVDRRNPDKLSIVELAYDEALILKKPLLVFMMDNDHPVSPTDIESDKESQQKLQDFKDRLERQHTIAYFTSPDELYKQVLTILQNLPK